MEANDDVATVRVLVKDWLRAWDGPDFEGLCGCTDERAAFFLRPDTDDNGQALSWRVFSQRLKTVLVRARQGPRRPRIHVEKPRFTIEVRGAVASVFWHSDGSTGWKRTRALVLFKDEGEWAIRHVQIWSLLLQFKASVQGGEHWLDLLPLLESKDLSPDFLTEAASRQKLWFAVCGFMSPGRPSLPGRSAAR